MQENVNLAAYNTFGIAANARYFFTPSSLDELREALRFADQQNLPHFILGGGSNVVLSGDFNGVVIKPELRGIHIESQNGSDIVIAVAAGEVWHELVLYTLDKGWFGLENLSLIPGSVGAAPVQNIGAYGVELVDVMHSLTALHIASGELKNFTRDECRFSYRESIFKQELLDQYVIVEVRFQLSTVPHLKMGYGDIQKELSEQGISDPSAKQLSDAIIAIRSRKLPDPKVIGNAGSFFKNPIISADEFERVKLNFPEVVSYPAEGGVKLAAGWLIDQAGWKGKQLGPVGAYKNQALVLVNHGGATGADVLAAARAIQADVKAKFGVELHMEPRVY